MASSNSKLRPVYRVHAFSVDWSEVPGFPIDLTSLSEVTALLKRWEGIRRTELVAGQVPGGNDCLIGVSCVELEVIYE